jgi:hypothetical protein
LKNDTDEKAEERYQQFLKNVYPYRIGSNGRLSIMRMDSLYASASFNDKSVDMVFIDGDHSEDGIRSDIRAWLPKTKKIICGHDYTSSWPDVKKVVDAMFGDRVKSIDTIWWVEL